MGQLRANEEYPEICVWRSKLLQSGSSSRTKLVGLALSYYYAPGELTFPTLEMLARDCHVTLNTVRAGLKHLEKLGLIAIRKERLSGTSTNNRLYFFSGINDNDPSHQVTLDRCHRLEIERDMWRSKCELLEYQIRKFDKVVMMDQVRSVVPKEKMRQH